MFLFQAVFDCSGNKCGNNKFRTYDILYNKTKLELNKTKVEGGTFTLSEQDKSFMRFALIGYANLLVWFSLGLSLNIKMCHLNVFNENSRS